MGVLQNIEFKVVDHSELPGRKIVECWRDGVFVATIYPHQDGLHIASKYMTALVQEGHFYYDPPRIISAIVKLAQEVVSGS